LIDFGVMILYDTFEPFRKAYLAEFRSAQGLERHNELVYQYTVDAIALGLTANEIVSTLFVDEDSIVMDPTVQSKFPSAAIDYFKTLDYRKIYADAGVPLDRDFADGKYKY